MLRRLAAVVAAAVALGWVAASTALAYTTNPDASAVAGTCTIGGVSTSIDSLDVVFPANPFRADATRVVFDYQLLAHCGTDFVFADFTVPAQWSINDTAGTLTVSGITVPPSFVGESYDGSVATATITSGAGVLSPVVWGADNSAEKRTVVSYHKKINQASTETARASYLNQLRSTLL